MIVRFYSILTTIIITAAISFGAGIYCVENEAADHFRAFVRGGLATIHGVAQTDNANLNVPLTETSQAKNSTEALPKVSAETLSKAPGPNDSAKTQPNTDVATPSQQSVSNRDSAVPSNQAEENKGSQPASGLAVSPSGTVPMNSPSNIGNAGTAVSPIIPPATPNKPPHKKVEAKKQPKELKEHQSSISAHTLAHPPQAQ